MAGDWSEEEIEAAGKQLAAADPLAEVRLDFKCPGCGEDFEENLDLASFLWSELQARAERLLVDVHCSRAPMAGARLRSWAQPGAAEFLPQMVRA